MGDKTLDVSARLRLPRLWVLVSVVSLLLAAACTGAPTESEPPGRQARAAPPAPPPSIRVVPADGAEEWQPAKPLQVTVHGGRLTKVTVRGHHGEPVEGELDDGHGTWTPRWSLHPDTTYRVRLVAVNADGRKTTKKTTFTTVEPASTVRIDSINAADGTYGVGLPIVIRFTDPIDNKKRVEQAIEIRTSTPITGAWYWVNDEELHFRPKHYWPPGTKVHLIAHLEGVRAGEDMYGDDNLWARFRIGKKHLSTVNADTHTMTVTSGGDVVRRFPISAGDPEHPSSSGTFAAISAQQHIVMDSASYGVPVNSPGGYSIDTYWNVRYTWSGQFVHSAPWSVGSQGSANVSHGCINASPANAEWFYHFTQVGDVITVKGTPRDGEWGNGWTDWEKTFADYLDGGATGKPVHTLTMNGRPRTPDTGVPHPM